MPKFRRGGAGTPAIMSEPVAPPAPVADSGAVKGPRAPAVAGAPVNAGTAPLDNQSRQDFKNFGDYVSSLSVAELKALIADGMVDAKNVIRAEKAGKNRKTILDLGDA